MINLPAFCEFPVSNHFVDFFNGKLDFYKTNQNLFLEYNSGSTKEGIQTHNMLDWKEKDVLSELNFLKLKLENKCQNELDLFWCDLIEYEKGGWQKSHCHSTNEDISLVIYLNDCVGGETYFILNQQRDVIKEIKPEKGKCVMFLSSIRHGAKIAHTPKRVLVVGLRIK